MVPCAACGPDALSPLAAVPALLGLFRENSKRLAPLEAVNRKVSPIGREDDRAAQFFAEGDECGVGVVHGHIGVLVEEHRDACQ